MRVEYQIAEYCPMRDKIGNQLSHLFRELTSIVRLFEISCPVIAFQSDCLSKKLHIRSSFSDTITPMIEH